MACPTDMTPSSYNLDIKALERERLLLALSWRYGADRTAKIIGGHDPKTNADIAAWSRLGRPK